MNHKHLRPSYAFWEKNVNTLLTKMLSAELTGPQVNDHLQEDPHIAFLKEVMQAFVTLTLLNLTHSMSYLIGSQVSSFTFTHLFTACCPPVPMPHC